MRLSDLLRSEVIDLKGNKIGRVHEVRAVQDGPLQDAFGAALRIEGLIIGRGSIGTRLGLDRPDANRPAGLRKIFQGVIGRRLYVPWDQIAAIEPGRIVIRGSAQDLQAPVALSSREQVDAEASS